MVQWLGALYHSLYEMLQTLSSRNKFQYMSQWSRAKPNCANFSRHTLITAGVAVVVCMASSYLERASTITSTTFPSTGPA